MSAQHELVNAAKYGQLAALEIGSHSVHSPKGYTATTPVSEDNIVDLQPDGGVTPTFGSTVQFSMPKNSTLIDRCTLVLDISAGVNSAGRSSAYVKNLGDQIMSEVVLRYGSHTLQAYPGVFQYVWRRLTRHDNHLEGINGQVLGGLPPGAPTETARQTAVTTAFRLYCPLEELYFVHNRDEAWMTEAHSLEGQIRITLNTLARLVYSDNGGDPFTTGTYPAITNAFLRYREVQLSAPEKAQRLALYRSPQGVSTKFNDLERQEQFVLTGTGGAAARTFRIPLDNFRMSMAEIMFMVRTQTDSTAAISPGAEKNWAGDAVESSTVASIITGASVATLQTITSFRLESNGKILFQDMEEAWNRMEVRQRYHPDAQIADPIYTIPFALFPEDRKNCTGHVTGSVLGKLELVITMTDWAVAAPRIVDVWAHSYNFIQEKSGGVVKALQ